MKSSDIRKTFTQYFVKNGHAHIPSSASIPHDDPTLLFTNAGMNQFKNVFLGFDQRPYNRAVTVQKCVRAGGKHNDLDSVGMTARHHTFFEMMGNFSFGNYFKKEAIHFAWELLTKELGIPKEKLYVTVFENDDEALEIWHRQEGVPKDRIFKFGEKDNFWRMGETGPCGPCSEIFFDHGPGAGVPGKEDPDPYKNILSGGDRFVEIWNLVFMQFNESAPGQMQPLPNPSIDTGGGLERWAAALQGKPVNFDTDLFLPLIETACKISGAEYITDTRVLLQNTKARETTQALRVIADHARAAAFLLADGVVPSNEGRGYVLRRIMRRAIRFANKLSDQAGLYPSVVNSVAASLGDVYPELLKMQGTIRESVEIEESRFNETLITGTQLLEQSLQKLSERGQKVLDGKTVFKLYDTYGFPADLTRLMALEKGITTDEQGFESAMKDAKSVARASWRGGKLEAGKESLKLWASKQTQKTNFIGYTELSTEERITGLLDESANEVEHLLAGQEGFVFCQRTPFYAESGGQVGDSGTLSAQGLKAEVFDCKKIEGCHLLSVRVLEGKLELQQTVQQQVDQVVRREIMAHHSATHLLHAALKKILGDTVAQAGSAVYADRLRFDFNYARPVTEGQIFELENLVNQEISQSSRSSIVEMKKDAAIQKGAVAMFGEKYDDLVRVVELGSSSMELCGGTHVENTVHIRAFKILSETGVSSGVRRIEAIAGATAVNDLRQNARSYLEALRLTGVSSDGNLGDWIDARKSEIKDLKRDLQQTRLKSFDAKAAAQSAKTLEFQGRSFQFLSLKIDSPDRQFLSQVGDQLLQALKTSIVVLLGQSSEEGQTPISVSVSKDLTQTIKAGDVLKTLCTSLEGKGGGRPDFAQGAVARSELFEHAIENYVEQNFSRT